MSPEDEAAAAAGAGTDAFDQRVSERVQRIADDARVSDSEARPHNQPATAQAMASAKTVAIHAAATISSSADSRSSTRRSDRPDVTVPPFHRMVIVATRIPSRGCQVIASR